MARYSEDYPKRFHEDFARVANRLSPGGLLNIELVRSVLSRSPTEEESVFHERCALILNAYSFVAKNAQGLLNIQLLERDGDGHLSMAKETSFALYIFFSGTLFLNREPSLELFIDAAQKAAEGNI